MLIPDETTGQPAVRFSPFSRCPSMPVSLRHLIPMLVLGVLLSAPATSSAWRGRTPTCTYVASPAGSDANPGTVSAPFQTAQKLADSLSAGETGCLEAGTYYEDLKISAAGTASAPVTLTSYPGQVATITGRLWVAQGADYVTVTALRLNGTNSENLPSPTINANYDSFTYDDVTNDHTGICFLLGGVIDGAARGTRLAHDRIHGCGELPSTNHDHGIYLAYAYDTRIEWNLIYDNVDRGIQFYPNAQGTIVDHNIIDGNGEGVIFSGDNGDASSNNEVYDNIISNAVIRYDIESFWPQGNPVGTGNSVFDNCVWGGNEGTIGAFGGFTAWQNTDADPQYLDAAGHDYRLAQTSPCLPITGDIAATFANVPLAARLRPTKSGSAA